MAKIADVDWIIEVVVERLYQKLVLNKLKNTVNQDFDYSNTSGIPFTL
jgi:3-hydroxyacyl-CoA dehydrogenase